MLNSPLCDLLEIDYPIIQGGMAWIADAQLASAVSEAGGLGLISAMNAGADWLRGQISEAKSKTTRPFGVNIMLQSPHVDEVAQVVIDEGVKVVTTGAGNPAKYMPAWKEAGITVIPVVASVAFARLVQRSGAAAVIAEGCESGGHVGDSTTMALVPQVCDAVDIPVIAAGGIADGRGLAAALCLGAVGAQMGTRFLVAEECSVHENYKEKILAARDIDTIATGKRLGHPVRSIKNTFSREYFKQEYDSTVSDADLEALGSGVLRLAAVEGDMKNGCVLAGQIAGMVHRRQSAEEIICEVCAEAENILEGALKWVN